MLNNILRNRNKPALPGLVALILVSWTLIVIILPLWQVPVWVRLPLTLPYLLFVPGYLVLKFLFNKAGSLQAYERTILSVTVSIVVLIALGTALIYLNLEISMLSLSLTLGSLSLVLLVIQLIMHAVTLPEAEATIIHSANFRLVNLGMVLAASTISIAVAVLAAQTLNQPLEDTSAFYILDQNHLADSYPIDLKQNQAVVVILGIQNDNARSMDYRIEASEENSVIWRTEVKNLAAGQKWEDKASFNLAQYGNPIHKIKLELYRWDQPEVYRHLELILKSV